MKMKMTILAVLMAVTPHSRATISRALRWDNLEVVWATDRTEAVAASAKLHPDLVVLDLNQPLATAWDEVESIRAANPSTPIVVLAEREAAHDRNRTDPNVTVVEKPFGGKALAETVNALLFSAGSRTPSFSKGGDSGGPGMEAEKFRESLLARHDTPLALAPSYRHWGINE